MSEQQRIFMAVALCLGIMLLWPFITGKKETPPAKGPSATATSETKPGKDLAAGTPTETPPPDATSAEATAPAEATPAEDGSVPVVEAVPESRRSFATPFFQGELSNVRAALTRLELTEYDERPPEEEAAEQAEPSGRLPVSLVTSESKGGARQAELKWKLGSGPMPRLRWTAEGDALSLEGSREDGLVVRIRVQPRTDAYALDYDLSVENQTPDPLPVGVTMHLALARGSQKSSGWFSPSTNVTNGLCALPGGLERIHDATLEEDGEWKSPGNALWAGIDRQYFVVAVVPGEGSGAATCNLSADKEDIGVDYVLGQVPVAAGETWQRKLTVFLGPKRDDMLGGVAPQLKDVIDYSIWGIPLGALARPMVFLMNVFHGWTGSWGVAIMLLTLVVKALLFPITYKSSVSMRKMQLLRPELDKLKKQFEGDRERQQMEQMKLFKEKGVNPLGGCLPMLLQMPVWFALYRTLWTAVDLYQQPFLWLPDLTAKEPVPVMAFVLGGLTFLQQKLMPTATDSQQAKIMMYFMPVMMTVFMIALPSGLVLYILFNSILTIIQQLVINKRTTKLA